MPGMKRTPRNSVTDRPSRLKLLLRRQRWALRPALCAGLGCAALAVPVLMWRASASTVATWRDSLGHYAASAGLRVADIIVEGRANTPEPLLRAAIGISKGDPILGISVAAVRGRIETLSWIQHATVERRLPGQIVVRLEERRPIAIWQNAGKFVLIDRAGQVVEDQDLANFKDLPLVVGSGAPAAAAALLSALTDRPDLQKRMVAAVRIGERRWNLHLNSGTDVLLPEGAEAAALQRLAELQKDHALLDRPLQIVDMRAPDRLVVRPAPPPPPPAPEPGKKPA